MKSYIKQIAFVLFALWTLSGVISCSQPDKTIAGGSSEETNAVAGIIQHDGNVVANTIIMLRKVDFEPIDMGNSSVLGVISDTTSKDGTWRIANITPGDYMLEAMLNDSLKSMQRIEVVNDTLDLGVIELHATKMIAGFISDIEGEAEGVKVYLEGTDYYSYTNADGFFNLVNIPNYPYTVSIQSHDEYVYDDMILEDVTPVKMSSSDLKAVLNGVPLDSLNISVPVNSPIGDNGLLELTMPLKKGYAVQSHWGFNSVANVNNINVISDETGRENYAVLYGENLFVDGIVGKAWNINGDVDFAVAEDTSALQSENYSITGWFKVDSIPKDSSFKINLFGKFDFNLGFDVFSFNLQKNSCGNIGLAVALDVVTANADNAFNCENTMVHSLDEEINETVISDTDINQWFHLAATFNEDEIRFYFNGKEVVANVNLSADNKYVMNSKAPFYFAKERFYGAIDDIKIYNIWLPEHEITALYNQDLYNATNGIN